MSLTETPPVERTVAPPQAPRTLTVVAQLAARETLRRVHHPFALCGLALTAMLLVVSQVDAWDATLPSLSVDAVLLCAPLAIGAFLAGHAAMSRDRRANVQALVEATPTAPHQRVAVHLVASLGPALLTIVALTLWMSWLMATTIIPGSPRLPELAAAVIVVAGSGAGGVALGARIASRTVAMAGVGLLAGSASVLFFQMSSRLVMGEPYPIDVLWWSRPSWTMLGYATGLAVTMAVSALVLAGAHRAWLVGLAAAIAATAIAATNVMVPPAMDEVRRYAGIVARPAEYRECHPGTASTACLLPGYERWADVLNAQAAATLAPIPAGERPPIIFDQYVEPWLASLTADSVEANGGGRERVRLLRNASRAAQRAGSAKSAADSLRISTSELSYLARYYGQYVAQRAVGLPVIDLTTEETFDAADTCTAEGQAREVVAIWLYARANRNGFDEQLAFADEVFVEFYDLRSDTAYAQAYLSLFWDDVLALSYDSAELVRRLLERPDDHVRPVIARDWDHWVDPATPVDELLTALELEPVDTLPSRLNAAGIDPRSPVAREFLDGAPHLPACP